MVYVPNKRSLFKTSLESWLCGLCWKLGLVYSGRGSKFRAPGFRDVLVFPTTMLSSFLLPQPESSRPFCRVDSANHTLAACHSCRLPRTGHTLPLYYHVGVCPITLRVILRSPARDMGVGVLPGVPVLDPKILAERWKG
jgi:hypothetical protein